MFAKSAIMCSSGTAFVVAVGDIAGGGVDI